MNKTPVRVITLCTPQRHSSSASSQKNLPSLNLICTLALFLFLLQQVQAGPPPGTGQWTLRLDEEFNGTSLNTAIWNTGQRFDCIVPGEIQGYRPENVIIGGGICSIKVEYKPGTRNQSRTGYECGTADYASGMIETYGKWTQAYGYFEARIKMATGKGTWPAFWLMPDRGPSVTPLDSRVGIGTRGGVVPMGNEIDIFEYMGTWQNPTTGLSKSHSGYFWDYSGGVWSSYTSVNKLQNPNNQYHTYGLYWAPGLLVYYIDGRPVLSRNDPVNIAVCPHYILVNCAVTQNDWTGTDVPLADITASLPCTMDVDYVKVYTGTAPGNESGDIGAVGLAGSDSVNSTTGVYTLNASGGDINGTADAFHYTCHQVTGDCTITARVDSLTQTDPLAKAGVMLRQQVDDPGSANAFMLIPASAPASFQSRTTSGGSTSVSSLVQTSTLVDDGFTDGGRSNGADLLDAPWFTLGTPSVSLADDSAGIGTGSALQLTATSTGRGLLAGIPPRTLADGDSLTLFFDWRFTGTTGLNQSKNLRFGFHSSNGTATTADGNTTSDNDKGYFVGTNPGAAASTGTILHRENGNSPAILGGNDWVTLGTAGTSVNAGTSPHLGALTVRRVGTALQVTSSIDNLPVATGTDNSPVTYTFDEVAVSLAGATLPSPMRIDNVQVDYSPAVSSAPPPGWVRLKRTGNVFTGYYSADGITWTQAGSQTISMPATIYVGLAATAHNNSAVTTAKFSNVQLDPFFASEDIGAVGLSGSDSVNSGTYTVLAGGAGIGGTADACRFLSQSLVGDGSITAKVNSVSRTDYAAMAAVMMRADNSPGAISACMEIPSFSTMGLIYRTSTDGASGAVKGATVKPPLWVRLTRSGNTFSGYWSADGVTWNLTGSQTIVMPTTIKVGLAVTSHNVSALTTAVIDNVTITGTRGL